MEFELYKAYKTRSGRKAIYVGASSESYLYPNMFVHYFDDGTVDETLAHTMSGSLEDDGVTKDWDIIGEWREPRRLEAWVNVYIGRSGEPSFSGCFHKSKEEAVKASQGSIDTIKVTWEEKL